MKQKIQVSMLFTIIILVVYSCNKSNFLDYDLTLNNTSINLDNKSAILEKEFKRNYKSWEDQLDFLKHGGYLDILKKNDLTLVSYELQKKEYHGEYSGRYTRTDSTNSITITLAEKSIIDPFLKKRRNEYTTTFKDNDLRIVKLLWKYKNEQFHTDCIVSISSSTVVYDDIISNLNFVFTEEGIIKKSNNSLIESKHLTNFNTEKQINFSNFIPLNSTMSEEEPVSEVGDYIFYKNISLVSPWGDNNATARVAVTVTRKKIGNQIHITDFTPDSYSVNNFGFASHASSKILDYTMGANGLVRFNYAYAVGIAGSLTISSGPMGVTVSGGSVARSGERNVQKNTPSDIGGY